MSYSYCSYCGGGITSDMVHFCPHYGSFVHFTSTINGLNNEPTIRNVKSERIQAIEKELK